MQKAGQKIRIIDQGSILLVVYAAFSSAVVGGLWQQMPLAAMATLLKALQTASERTERV